MTNATLAVCHKIGEFYLALYDDADLAREAVRRLGISAIEYDPLDGRVTIRLERPGLLIGPQGKTIDALADYLGPGVHVRVVETPNDAVNAILRPIDDHERLDSLDHYLEA